MTHPFALPGEYVERAIKREGREHSVEELQADRTALVVVDMQRYFMEPPFAGACPVAQEVVPNVNTLAAALRGAGGMVVWLQMEAPALETGDWPVLSDRYLQASARARWEALDRGAAGFELWPDLDVRAKDVNIVKRRYSAFIQGSSTADEILRRAGVETILIAGVATNVCCESTARDAMMLDYRVVMVSDACAAATDAEHAASLCNFYLFFGDVQTTQEVVSLISA